MSSKSTNTKSSSDNGSGYQEKSTNSYYKPYGGWPGFMASHGLKTYDQDDVEEGKAIIQAFKDADRADYEEQQAQKTQGK
ncbi:hypothetical protein BDZ89DRAFT_1161106 [Hymenopellis radicata]|nr:hypothetical protein BDZ89DRAFT_1161106 [Hymenopellis radicata]